MTVKEQTLYYLLEDHGYTQGTILTAMKILSQSREALDDAIIFVEDSNPSENELIEYIVQVCL